MAALIRKLVKITLRFSDKPQAVKDYFHWDFIKELAPGRTVVSAEITATVVSGTDPSASSILSGSPTVLEGGRVVRQLVQNGVVGVLYQLSCVATLDNDDELEPFETQLKVVA